MTPPASITIACGAIYQLGDTRLLFFPDGSASLCLGTADPVALAPSNLYALSDLATLLSAPIVQTAIDRILTTQQGVLS